MQFVSKQLNGFTDASRTALEKYKADREEARLKYSILVKSLLAQHRDAIIQAARDEILSLLSDDPNLQIDVGAILHTIIQRAMDPRDQLSGRTLFAIEDVAEDIFNSLRYILISEFPDNILRNS